MGTTTATKVVMKSHEKIFGATRFVSRPLCRPFRDLSRPFPDCSPSQREITNPPLVTPTYCFIPVPLPPRGTLTGMFSCNVPWEDSDKIPPAAGKTIPCRSERYTFGISRADTT